jgi:O-antigen/teichoic acid export membrane protein
MPLLLLPLVGWVSGQADRYVIGGIVGLESAGLYAAVYGIASRPFMMVRDSVELVLRQVFYAQFTEGDVDGQRRVFALWLTTVLGVSLLGLLGVVVLHRTIAELLLAAEYRAYSSLMIWIAAGYVLFVTGQVVERVCYALHDTRGVLLVEVGGAVLGVVIVIPMVLVSGVQGAAWAVPIYFGLQLGLAVWRARYAWRRASMAVA